MDNSILGYDWDAIRRAQQLDMSGMRRTVPSGMSSQSRAAEIMRDVERFKIPVSAMVVSALGLTLPEGYKLDGETFRFSQP